MSEEIIFESERDASPSEVAASLRRLADALERDADLAFGPDLYVPAPTELEYEIELERAVEDDETEYELELELEWELEGEPAEADAGASADDEVAAEAPHAESTGSEPVPEEPAPEGAVDVTVPAESQATFEVYRDRADEYRWRLRHRNGNVVADSGEGYARKHNAENGLESVKRNAPGAPVEYEEE